MMSMNTRTTEQGNNNNNNNNNASFETWALSLPSSEYGQRLLELGATWETFASSTVMDDLVQGAGIPYLAARTLVQKALDVMEQRNAPLVVFWDMDSTMSSTMTTANHQMEIAVDDLQSLVSSYGKLCEFRCYTSSTVSDQVRSILSSKGCLLVEASRPNPSMAIASTTTPIDVMIAVDAMKFAYGKNATSNSKATLCLVASDGSTRFAYLLAELKQRRTLVVSYNQEGSNSKDTSGNAVHLPMPASCMASSFGPITLPLSPPPGLGRNVVLEPYELDIFHSHQRLQQQQLHLQSPLSIAATGAAATATATYSSSTADRDVIDELCNRTIVCNNEPISPLYVPRSILGTKIAASFHDDSSDTKTSSTTQEDSNMWSSSLGSSLDNQHSPNNVLVTPSLATPSLAPSALSSGPSIGAAAAEAPLNPSLIASSNRAAPISATTAVPTGMAPCWLCQVCLPKKDMVPVCHRRSKYHCASCYNWGTPQEKAVATKQVVALMTTFASNDDIVITDSLLRHKLVERYPHQCSTLPRATLWIEGAIKCGALDFLPHCGLRQKCVCLPEYTAQARAPQPKPDVDTTREEAYLKDLLTKSVGGWKTRRAVIAALQEKFPTTMSTPAMRTKVVDSACAKRLLILRGNATTQVLAFSKVVAENELHRLTVKATAFHAAKQ